MKVVCILDVVLRQNDVAKDIKVLKDQRVSFRVIIVRVLSGDHQAAHFHRGRIPMKSEVLLAILRLGDAYEVDSYIGLRKP